MVATRRSLASSSEALIMPESLEINPERTIALATGAPRKKWEEESRRRNVADSDSEDEEEDENEIPVDAASDDHEEYEFGGPLGTLAMMIFFPLLIYYMWICLTVYDGKLQAPASLEATPDWLRKMYEHVKVGASPTPRGFAIYGGLMVFQLLLALILPGYKQEGLPIASLRGKRLMYNCNALSAWYITLATALGVQYLGIFDLAELIDHFGEIMTVAQITGFVAAAWCYVAARLNGSAIRMSGNLIYDYFMGASLNPRIGSVDIKMWAEVRIPWVLLFLFALAGCVKQYETYGYVSPNQAFMILASGSFLNACAKGEELIPQTWDMAYEKFGWLLSYWNLCGVPFTYCYSIIYMATHDPATYRFPTWAYVALYSTFLTAYYVWDSSMAQKSKFKMDQAGNYRPRYAFPQVPWSYIPNAKYLQTSKGKLLIDGWWAYVRKPNYAADTVQVLCWALCSGFGSILSYWYPFFFIIMILHRNGRDEDRCARKYGKDWVKYKKIVPYKYIYGVY